MIYVCWGVYIVAAAAQLIYWGSMAPMAMTQKRVGMDGGLAAEWIWLVGLSALAVLAWPVFGLLMPYYDNDPSIFSAILMTLGSWLLGWLVSMAAKGVLGSTMTGLDDMAVGRRLQQIANVVTVVCLVAVVLAYIVVFNAD